MNGAVLANLRLIHRAAGFFWIEDSAYRDARTPDATLLREHRCVHQFFDLKLCVACDNVAVQLLHWSNKKCAFLRVRS